MSEQRKIITCPRCQLLLGVRRARPYVDLWAEMERKHAYNRTRTRRHGGKAL